MAMGGGMHPGPEGHLGAIGQHGGIDMHGGPGGIHERGGGGGGGGEGGGRRGLEGAAKSYLCKGLIELCVRLDDCDEAEGKLVDFYP